MAGAGRTVNLTLQTDLLSCLRYFRFYGLRRGVSIVVDRTSYTLTHDAASSLHIFVSSLLSDKGNASNYLKDFHQIWQKRQAGTAQSIQLTAILE